MLSPAEIYRMVATLDVVLKTCIRDRRALVRKEAEFIRPELEKLRQTLAEAAEKRSK
jgi:hypothetical protein